MLAQEKWGKRRAPLQTPRGLGPRHLTLSGKDGGGNQAGTPAPQNAHYGTRPEGLTVWDVKERDCKGVAHRGVTEFSDASRELRDGGQVSCV